MNANLKDIIDNFNNSCKKDWKVTISNEDLWILEFPYKIIFDLIENHAEKISNQISEICEKEKDIESIIYVGGYCSNDVLISYFKKI